MEIFGSVPSVWLTLPLLSSFLWLHAAESIGASLLDDVIFSEFPLLCHVGVLFLRDLHLDFFHVQRFELRFFLPLICQSLTLDNCFCTLVATHWGIRIHLGEDVIHFERSIRVLGLARTCSFVVACCFWRRSNVIIPASSH